MVIMTIWAVWVIVLEAQADPFNVLLNYGVLGLAFFLVVFGRGLHTSGELKAKDATIETLEKELVKRDETIKERDEIIRAKDDVLDAVRFQITHRTIPALARNSEVLEAIPQSEANINDLLEKTMSRIEVLTNKVEELGGEKEG